MRILKKILVGIVVLIAIGLIAALFVKKQHEVVREIVISKPKQQVFDYIKYLKNQESFTKWATLDPNMKKTYTGTDGTVGFVSAWEGNKEVGQGEQEIKAIAEGQRVDFELRFKKPMESTSTAYMTTDAVNDSTTKVKWGFHTTVPYPMNLMCAFMNMDQMIGDDFQYGLDHMKANLEKQ